ncbi:MAG: hypothetical protein ACI81V_000570 [Lentimonas sp.]|jgi:hypothetical protein
MSYNIPGGSFKSVGRVAKLQEKITGHPSN